MSLGWGFFLFFFGVRKIWIQTKLTSSINSLENVSVLSSIHFDPGAVYHICVLLHVHGLKISDTFVPVCSLHPLFVYIGS